MSHDAWITNIADKKFMHIISDLPMQKLAKLALMDKSFAPMYYVNDYPTRSGHLPQQHGLPWPVSFLLSFFHKKHIFGDASAPCMWLYARTKYFGSITSRPTRRMILSW